MPHRHSDMFLIVAAVALLTGLFYFARWLFAPVIGYMRESGSALTTAPQFIDSKTQKSVPFPLLFDAHDVTPASLSLSLIVPSYNEQERLPIMMEETLNYLTAKKKKDPSFTYEIIVVDDGSRDKTSQVALEFSRKHGSDVIRVMTLTKNVGKGGAVQQGMLHARGERLLMVDADGATQIADLDKLDQKLSASERNGFGVALGSRSHLEDAAVAQRSALRNLLMHGFHLLVSVLAVRGIRDTQCGFKLFTRRSAALVFRSLHLKRWCFDVEALYMLSSVGCPLVEVAVNWQEIPGSKLNILDSTLTMARDLFLIRLCFTLGVWKITDATQAKRQIAAKISSQ